MSERLSKGTRQHIRELKPEARASLTESSAWESVQEILRTRVEDYPGKFGASMGVVRKFHQLRWENRYSPSTSLRESLNQFMEENSPEVLDELRQVFGVIAQIYSRP